MNTIYFFSVGLVRSGAINQAEEPRPAVFQARALIKTDALRHEWADKLFYTIILLCNYMYFAAKR